MTTEEIERHFSGLFRFGKSYVQENRLTAGNLMELMVYVDEVMRPHREWIGDMMFHEVSESPEMEKDEIHKIYEHWDSYRANLHPDYREQKQVYSLLNDELFQLRQQQKAAIKDDGHKLQPIRQRIEGFFEFLTGHNGRDNPHILSELDFKKLVDWVTFYFENDFTPPIITQPIYRKNTTRGIIIHAFKEFFKIEFPGYQFPDSLFELIKACFYELRDDNIENLKKTKEPRNYRNLQTYNG